MKAQIVVVPLLALPSFLGAQISCESGPASLAAPCYVETMASSLARAHRGYLTPDRTAATSALDGAAEVMYKIQLRRRSLDEAAKMLQPFLEAPDSLVRESATIIVMSYRALATNDSTLLVTLRNQLDGVAAQGTGTQAEQLASFRMRRRNAAEGMILGVTAVTFALLEPTKNKAKRLRITRSERDQLLAQLHASFGDALVARKGQWGSDFAAAAAVLQQFVSNPGWQFRATK